MRREFKRIGEVMRKAITPKYGKEFSASTGLSDGTVDAGGGWMWCVMDSSGQPIKAYNGNKVPVQARLKVKLGYQKGDPRVLRILRVRNVWDEIIPSALGYHGSTHTFPSPDTVWIEQAQYMPLMVQPKSGFVVSIREGVIQWGADVVTVPSQDFDLSADYVSTGARWALIQADNTGTVSRKLGALVDTQWLLTDADIPAPDTDNVALAAIMLYTGQELISRNQYVNDVRDLRTWYSGTGGGGGTGTGDVIQTGSVTSGHLASWDSDKHIEDSGIVAADVITDPETITGALIAYGPNLITNGTFDTDATGWNVGANWAWESDGLGGGRMRHTAGSTAALSQSGTLVNGGFYIIYIDVGGTTGSVIVQADDGDSIVIPAGYGTMVRVLQWVQDIDVLLKFLPTTDFDGYVDAIYEFRAPFLQEAQLDSKFYVRKNGTWVYSPNVTFQVQSLSTIDSPFTMQELDLTHIWNAGGGNCIDNLLPATGSGRVRHVKKIDASANTVTVTPDGTDTIDGAANYVLTAQYESVTVQDCAVGIWYVI